MADRVWFLRVKLSDGSYSDIAIGELAPNKAADLFEKGQDPFDREWLETTNTTAVRRSAVIEYSVVPG